MLSIKNLTILVIIILLILITMNSGGTKEKISLDDLKTIVEKMTDSGKI